MGLQAVGTSAFAQKAKSHYEQSRGTKRAAGLLKGKVIPFDGGRAPAGLSFLIHTGEGDSIRVVTDTCLAGLKRAAYTGKHKRQAMVLL
jgi:hypothetical protein